MIPRFGLHFQVLQCVAHFALLFWSFGKTAVMRKDLLMN